MNMRKISLLSGLFLLAALMTVSCGSSDELANGQEQPVEQEKTETDNPAAKQDNTEDQQEIRNVSLTDAQKTAVAKNNVFAFDFFRTITGQELLKGKSIFVSPLSATYAMGMLNSGSKGATSDEITSMLGFANGTKSDINDLCKRLIEETPQVDGKVTLRLADCVVADQQLALSEAYQKIVSGYYGAELFSKDFSDPTTVDFVNGWCSRQTEGMIDRIVAELKPSQKMVLMNAIYFKAPWSGKFRKEDTQREAFYPENGDSKTLSLMRKTDATLYASNDLYKTVGLPYGNGHNWMMYVLLPNEGKSVGDVVASITADGWNKNKPVEAQQVDVRLPKFKMESDITLNEVFSSLGAKKMFSQKEADFSPMLSTPVPLWVDLVKQKAAIEVSEEGTEATAVTAVMVGTTDVGGPEESQIPVFCCNRPFVYLIQEVTSGAVFFIGTFMGE